ncbi:MAG: 50S ribosomal protein L25 [Candidatus Latescibacterota bacterium]|nr:MAG: 50S ribosomal protein L25 [Candidatus Latescibacterota bacterium]
MSEQVLSVEKRGTGKGQAKRLRRAGKIPGILYGGGEEPLPIALDRKSFEAALHRGGTSSVYKVMVDGKECLTVVKELQYHPVTDELLHVDLQRVLLTETVTVEVPLVAVGTPVGVKEGGVLDHIVHSVEVECLPTEIPERIEIDVSGLGIGDVIHGEDLKKMDPRVVIDPQQPVLTVVPPTKPLEEEEVEEVAEEPELVREREEAEE